MSHLAATLGGMDPLVTLLIGLIIGALFGLVLGRLRRASATSDPALIEARHTAAVLEVRAQESALRAELSTEIAGLQATASGLRDQVVSQQEQYREFVERSRAEQLAQTERERAESKVLQALTPVQETLRTMQLKVTELETQRSLQHGELAQQLKAATESDERLRNTTESLASARRS